MKSYQVDFTDEANALVDKVSKELADKYTPEIALVHPAEQRIKIARLSASLAAMTFSSDDDENLIIRSCHVQWVSRFLQKIYDLPHFGYDVYSQIHVHNLQFTDKEKGELSGKLRKLGDTFIISILGRAVIQRNDLQIWLGCSYPETNDMISYFHRHHALVQYGKGWRKTQPFKKLLEELRNDETIGGPTEGSDQD